MITYTFECKKCLNVFEFQRSIKDDTLPPCDKCKSKDVSLILSPSSFVINGVGNYGRGRV